MGLGGRRESASGLLRHGQERKHCGHRPESDLFSLPHPGPVGGAAAEPRHGPVPSGAARAGDCPPGDYIRKKHHHHCLV